MDARSMLLQMCAARLGQSGNPGAVKLIEQLEGGNGAPTPDLRELLGQMGTDNPMARIVSEHLARQEEARRNAPPVIDVAGEVTSDASSPGEGDDGERAAGEAAAAAVLELKSTAEAMFAELQMLRQRNEELAWALGACPVCWGSEVDCRSCRGRGHPGFRFPDARGFLTYVLPAARMWRLQKQQESAAQQRRAKPGDARVKVPANNNEQR